MEKIVTRGQPAPRAGCFRIADRTADVIKDGPSEKLIRYVAAHLLFRLDDPEKAFQFLIQRGKATPGEAEEMLDPLGSAALFESDILPLLRTDPEKAEELLLRLYLWFWEHDREERETRPLSEFGVQFLDEVERHANRGVKEEARDLRETKDSMTLPLPDREEKTPSLAPGIYVGGLAVRDPV